MPTPSTPILASCGDRPCLPWSAAARCGTARAPQRSRRRGGAGHRWMAGDQPAPAHAPSTGAVRAAHPIMAQAGLTTALDPGSFRSGIGHATGTHLGTATRRSAAPGARRRRSRRHLAASLRRGPGQRAPWPAHRQPRQSGPTAQHHHLPMAPSAPNRRKVAHRGPIVGLLWVFLDGGGVATWACATAVTAALALWWAALRGSDPS